MQMIYCERDTILGEGKRRKVTKQRVFVYHAPFGEVDEEVEAGSVVPQAGDQQPYNLARRTSSAADGGPCAPAVEPARRHGDLIPDHAPCACIRP